MNATQIQALAEAKRNTLNARRAYNAAWRKDPTAKGYPAVDKALAELQAAERAEAVVKGFAS